MNSEWWFSRQRWEWYGPIELIETEKVELKHATGPETGPAFLRFLSCMAVFKEEKMCIFPWVVRWNLGLMRVNFPTFYKKSDVSLRRKAYFSCFSDSKIDPIFERVLCFLGENVHVFGSFLQPSLRSFFAVRALIWWLRFTKRHCHASHYGLIIGWRLVKLLGIIRLQDFQHASMVPVWASTLGT